MSYAHGLRVAEVTDGPHGARAPVDLAAPRITSPFAFSVLENSAWSIVLAADEAVTFAKRGGADGALFVLDGATLSLPAQDFEAGVTAFVCYLNASDALGNGTDFAVTVTIGDVDEIAPVITSAAAGLVDENAPYAVMLTASEPSTFTKRAGADGASFVLAGITLMLPAQDYEAGKTLFTCNLRATDGAGNVTDFTHAVTIRNVVVPVNRNYVAALAA